MEHLTKTILDHIGQSTILDSGNGQPHLSDLIAICCPVKSRGSAGSRFWGFLGRQCPRVPLCPPLSPPHASLSFHPPTGHHLTVLSTIPTLPLPSQIIVEDEVSILYTAWVPFPYGLSGHLGHIPLLGLHCYWVFPSYLLALYGGVERVGIEGQWPDQQIGCVCACYSQGHHQLLWFGFAGLTMDSSVLAMPTVPC